jgi:hypothetical protein
VIQRCERINFEKILSVDSIKKLAQKEHLQTPEPKVEFFSDALFIIPFTNIQYLFTSKPTHSKTYKVKSESRNLFSNQPADILFFQGDIHALQIKNDSLKCWSTNATLHAINNLLHQKNIKLIMLISPDKYDVYYDFIQQKETYEAPMFFTYFDALPKEYMYVSAMKKLSEAAAKQPDIYLYDDTHWSPIGAKIIADEIAGLIKPAQPEYGNF